MKLRETRLGRAVLRTGAGQRFWRWAHRLYDPWAAAAQLSAAYRRNMRQAAAEHGIRYAPAGGCLPPFVFYPPDLRFTAIFPDGERLPIHLTEERGYADIDGAQHLAVYRQFAEAVYPRLAAPADLPILDCACGSGYGAAFLNATLGRPTLGLDVDEGVVRFARKRYGAQAGLRFAAGDAADLGALADGSAAAVVSVETIEHVPAPERAVDEFWRVLAPGGALFMTTPDATGRPGAFTSAFHLREFLPAEFEALLRRRFAEVAVRGERGYLVGVARK